MLNCNLNMKCKLKKNSLLFRLNIFNDLIQQDQSFLSPIITQQLLKYFIKHTETPLKAPTLKSIRICCSHLLLCHGNSGTAEWNTFTSAIISDNSSSTNDVIHEKQLLLQLFIQHYKVDTANCLNLMQLIFNNRCMHRNDCIQTVLTIFENYEKLNILKSTELTCQVISWLYEYKQQAAVMTTDSIDINLVAKLASTVSINVLDVEHKTMKVKDTCSHLTKCLSLKFNSQFLCLDTHAKDLEALKNTVVSFEDSTGNCLIQLNYEKLMRTVNFETCNETKISNILQDLNHLRILTALFNQFVNFKIFDGMKCDNCLLIKRISLFLSHIQCQLIETQETYNVGLLKDLDKVLEEIFMNKLLNSIFKSQSLDGFYEYVKKNIAVCEKETITDDNDYRFEKIICLKICARVCVSEEQLKKAFVLIQKNKFDVKIDVDGIIEIIEVSYSILNYIIFK